MYEFVRSLLNSLPHGGSQPVWMYLAAGLLNIMDISLQHEYLQEYLQSAAAMANFSGANPYGLGGFGGLAPNGTGLLGGLDKNGTEVTITAPGNEGHSGMTAW